MRGRASRIKPAAVHTRCLARSQEMLDPVGHSRVLHALCVAQRALQGAVDAGVSAAEAVLGEPLVAGPHTLSPGVAIQNTIAEPQASSGLVATWSGLVCMSVIPYAAATAS